MKKAILLLPVLLLLIGCEDPKQKVDTILYNAVVYTVDSNFTKQEAIAIKDGKILKTGSSDKILAAFEAEESLDLDGKYVYPGLIDAHCHFMGYAEGLRKVNLYGTESFEDVIERVQEFQESRNLNFISGRGWDQNDWEKKEFPDRRELDSLFPEIPVVLSRIDGHALLVNQAALNYAGITKSTAIDGGILVKDEKGELTGVLIDNAESLINIPELPKQEYLKALEEAQANCFAYGLTTLDDAGLTQEKIELIDSLQSAGILKMRIYAMVSDDKEAIDRYLTNGKVDKPLLHVRSFKFYADGALGSRGACLLEPYEDVPHAHGLLINSIDHYKNAATLMDKMEFQMNTHAIGDSANRMMLEIYKEYTQNTDVRWRIEHAQVISRDDFDLFKKYNVMPSVQPTHATSDMYWAEERLGAERIEDAYAYKRLLDEYGKIALGTDFPVEDISTLKTFYAATARMDAEGFPKGGFQVENALSREEALKGMTIWAAFANFEEDRKGSLETGKYADLVIMDTDLMECEDSDILKAKVLNTYINGEQVFKY